MRRRGGGGAAFSYNGAKDTPTCDEIKKKEQKHAIVCVMTVIVSSQLPGDRITCMMSGYANFLLVNGGSAS